ncbi:electron transfer flavoprotein subunit beta/FixA family protein [Entomobacter blattae]|uniref:Electron transfer flavoprotein subunit beta n=1 Tax=Entomobacter blattae TaxID=2762277 RepID=A0A7H1NPS9_9PROT|nr:electron transfer flavoprotein subunit beta/FixA family protein [Entomobacter blattae]QNT77789.1 Electron transfer flavoprotein subunit beta [Entomobacter blattae]
MKLLVPVKRVVDYNIKPRIKPDNSGVEMNGIKMSMNPFDEIALEEAIRLKEKGVAKEVVAVTIGPQVCQDVLRTAMALGADRAILVLTEESPEPRAVAKLLKAVIEKEGPSLTILGKQAIDDDMNATGQMLAGYLQWPQATFASHVELDSTHVRVTVEVDAGQEVVRMPLPAVITADLRLNEPRFASLPKIMQARKKPIDSLTPADLGVDVSPRLEVLSVEEPPARKAGIIVSTVEDLVEKLRNEAKVL